MFVAKEDIIIITINVFIFIALFMDGILWDSIDSKKDPVTRRIGCQVFNNNYISIPKFENKYDISMCSGGAADIVCCFIT